MIRKCKYSLSTKTFFAIIIILLPIFITFFWRYYKSKCRLEEQVLSNLTVIAEAYEGQVYQFLEMSKRRVQDFASDGLVKATLHKKIYGKKISTTILNKHLLKNKLPLDKTIHTIHVLSLEGRVVASTNRFEIGKDVSNELYFVQGKGRVTIIESYQGDEGLPVIAVSAPVLARTTNKPIGVIVNFIRIAELNKILSGEYTRDMGAISWNRGRWSTMEVYLVDKEKLMLTESIFIESAALRQRVDTPPVRACLELNKEMSGFYKDYRGKEIAGASMYIPSMKWTLLVEIDKAEVLAPIKNIFVNAWITAVVIVVVIGVLFIGFVKKVVRPLRTISDAAKDIAAGNFGSIIPVQARDEIGRLCESFNTMSRDIKTRTMALVKSEASLAEAQGIAHLGNWEWNIVKNEVFWSDEIYRIYGFAPHEFAVTYEFFFNCVHPDDREFVKKSVEDALSGKKSYDIDFRIICKDGAVRHVHKKAVVVLDETGKAVRMVGTVQDITERKQLEEEMHFLQTMVLEVSASGDLHEALVVAIQKICDMTGWVYGEAWICNPENTLLMRNHAFYSRREELERFSTFSNGVTFPMGVGLPGRAWAMKQPMWIQDVTRDPDYQRAQIARDVGLKMGVAFPIISDNEVITVIVFYKLEAEKRDERLVRIVLTAVTQLGQVIKRKRAEDALRLSEERLRSILDNTSSIVYVKDLFGQYVFANKRFKRLHLIAGEKGKTDYDLWSKEMADAFRTNDKKVLEAKIPMEFDETVPQKDGLHTYISVKFPLFDSTGAIYAVCGISTDITERKHMEEQLQKLSCAVEQSPSTVIITDTKGNIQYVNPKFTQLTGYTPEEVIGKNPRILKSGKASPDEYKELWDAITSGREWSGEIINKKKGGEFYWELMSISPIKDARGVITNFLKVAEDITEIKQADEEKEKLREQLYHAQKMEAVGQLAGGIAHDFNNILTAIVGYGELLQMEMKADGLSGVYVQKILTSARRATKLTQGLLTFSRKNITDQKPIKLHKLIKDIENLLIRLIRENIELRVILSDKDITIMADSGQLEQVFMNLTTNASDAMPAGGIIILSTDVLELDKEFIKTHGYGKPGMYALISFSDTGVGMDETTKKRAFEPFFTTKEVGKGTGLGLAIVYGIIKQHNGYINVYSEPGKGTTFRIYLPLIESTNEEAKSEMTASVSGGTETILIAEDETEVRELTKTLLIGFGYKVIDAADGEDAIRKFVENKETIDLIVLDAIMPKKNGREVYEAIRNVKPEIKTIFVSGYGGDIIQENGLFEKGLIFIPKPISPTKFLKKVRQVLDK
ncbi:MAG: PAS domain S-box protein [Candidatus Brocadia sp.]|nr:PAS domain S-box protein [Candidatus Brocadia sp.]